MSVIHHQHLRKRRSKTEELKPYPHTNPWIHTLDQLTLLVGIAGPIMTLPQIIQIYSLHDASGVSLASWLAYSLCDIPFILYGVVHKDVAIIATYIGWFIANGAVVVGVLMY